MELARDWPELHSGWKQSPERDPGLWLSFLSALLSPQPGLTGLLSPLLIETPLCSGHCDPQHPWLQHLRSFLPEGDGLGNGSKVLGAGSWLSLQKELKGLLWGGDE